MRRVRTTANIGPPKKGKVGFGQPCRILAGGGLTRSHLSADLFQERGSGRVGLVSLPQEQGPPVPWLLLSASWSSADAHDALFHDLREGGDPQWLTDCGVFVTRGTLYWSLKAEAMRKIELSLGRGPLDDDSGVFKILLPRRLPAWLYLHSDAAQCFIQL